MKSYTQITKNNKGNPRKDAFLIIFTRFVVHESDEDVFWVLIYAVCSYTVVYKTKCKNKGESGSGRHLGNGFVGKDKRAEGENTGSKHAKGG